MLVIRLADFEGKLIRQLPKSEMFKRVIIG